MERNYFAKSPQKNGTQITVREHLSAVAALARLYGAELSLEREAELAGLFHDFGKYGASFQDLLLGLRSHIDHAFCGAAFLAQLRKPSYRPVIEAVNGHHDGLVSCSLMEPQFQESFRSSRPLSVNGGRESALAGREQYQAAKNAFLRDFPDFKFPRTLFSSEWEERAGPLPEKMDRYRSGIESMLDTRMLFSCLVDADYSISAQENDQTYLERSERTEFDPHALLQALYQYREDIKRGSKADPFLNQIRDQVFDACGRAGVQPPGCYTLTAPTGTGKTLALLHFALRHCESWGLRRIIILLPYLTLTEQNAGTYRHIVPNLLEDHSQRNLSDLERDFSARWRVPLVVTTSVKFFESLFANRPTDCRKLHNIANSVVIFDEAQSMPSHLLTATLLSIRRLCQRYNSTFLFSTATQPSFSDLPGMQSLWRAAEIFPEAPALFSALRRTEVEWRLKSRTPLEQISEEMAKQASVCAIVNVRKHARRLYSLLKSQCPDGEVFYLTTDLCPEHRRAVIRTVRARLEEKLPCRVVATQCIEAGVDLDFACMYRALAPLDAVIQAAGRCNRNGKINMGRVIVFLPDEEGALYPDNWYHNAAEKVLEMCAEFPVDIHSPEHVRMYYEKLFREARDSGGLQEAVLGREFDGTARAYRWIKDDGVRVIVPFIGQQQLYAEVEEQARRFGVTPALFQKAAGITVSLFRSDSLEQFAEPIPYSRNDGTVSRLYILRRQYLDCYLPDMGLQFPAAQDGQFW